MSTIPEGTTRVAVDIVVFTIRNAELKVLLIRRGVEPFVDAWALPGGFLLPNESLIEAAQRELYEETGVEEVFLEQLYTFGDPKRDPRGRVISISYFAFVSWDRDLQRGKSDAADAQWIAARNTLALAFDHQTILDYALLRLRYKLEWTTVGFQFLPQKFTLSELQHVYEVILGRELDKRNFRRKVDQLNVIKPLEEFRSKGVQRPARLFSFESQQAEHLRDRGILFPF